MFENLPDGKHAIEIEVKDGEVILRDLSCEEPAGPPVDPDPPERDYIPWEEWERTEGKGGLSYTDDVAEQHWFSGLPGGRMCDWPWLPFSPLQPDEQLELTYDFMYHENFQMVLPNFIKAIRLMAGNNQAIDINSHSHTDGIMGVYIKHLPDPQQRWKYPNHGGPYQMPLGKWVSFRWLFTNSEPGKLEGWIDGVKRWDHEIEGMAIELTKLQLNSTFNTPTYGEGQRRYWRRFNLRKL